MRAGDTNYADSKVVQAAQIDALIAGGEMKLLAPLSAARLSRIRDGVPDSWMRGDHAQILLDQGLVDY